MNVRRYVDMTGIKNTAWFSITNLIKAVEQVTQAGPLQSWSWIERMEASSKGVVAFLQHSFQKGQWLGQVALGIIVQPGQAVIHSFR